MTVVKYHITKNTSNKDLPEPIVAYMDADVVERIEKENVVVALTPSGKSLQIIMRNGKHVSSGERGLGLFIGEFNALDRKFKAFGDFDYTREAYGHL